MNDKKTKKRFYKYGIEIECIIPNGDVGRCETELTRLDHVGVSGDGSISCPDYDDCGLEVKIGVCTYKQMISTTHKVCEILSTYDAKVNQTCGLHVHMSNKAFFAPSKLKQILASWLAFEDVFTATQPASRLQNRYCQQRLYTWLQDDAKDLPYNKKQIIDKSRRESRYQTLNLNSLSKHGTLEVRLHSGTIESNKIIAWVQLLKSFYTYALNNYDKNVVDSLFVMSICDDKIKAFFDLMRVSDKVRKHFMQRINKFDTTRLVKQRKAAVKMLEILPKRQNLRKRLNAISDMYDHVACEYSNLMQSF